MSTRATYIFSDRYDSFTVYKHFDGYPKGAMKWIANALPYAWELPRFEACDFAAAFVRGNKDSGGDIYFSRGKDAHSDTEYHYVITCKNDEIWVKIEDFYKHSSEEGSLTSLLKKYVSNKEWV